MFLFCTVLDIILLSLSYIIAEKILSINNCKMKMKNEEYDGVLSWKYSYQWRMNFTRLVKTKSLLLANIATFPCLSQVFESGWNPRKAPTLNQLISLSRKAYNFLRQDKENVVAIHCLVCALLISYVLF